MNNEERIELMFETISKIAGFEVKPNKDFYIWENSEKIKYHIRSDLTLMFEYSKGVYEKSVMYTTLSILNGDYKLEEIKEPLVTDEERNFLKQFKFDELEVSYKTISWRRYNASPISSDFPTHLHMYDKNGLIVTSIDLNTINFSFAGLEKGKKYSGKELGLE